jgi:hypothetical protein
MEAEVRGLEWRRAARRRAGWTLAGVAVIAVAGDIAAGDGAWPFSTVVLPVALLGACGAAVATHPDPLHAAARLRPSLGGAAAGCLGFGMLAFLLLVLGGIVTAGDPVPFERALAAAIVLVAAFSIRKAFALPADAAAIPRPRLDAAVDALSLLEDELPRGKATTGWIDLTGPERTTKKFAGGTTASGWEVDVFRDEWFHAGGVLRDGSHLRVAAVEKRRIKHDRWKTASSGKRKLKRGATAQAHFLEMKLRAKGGVTASVIVNCSDPFTARELASGLAVLHQALRKPGAKGAAAQPPAAQGGAA